MSIPMSCIRAMRLRAYRLLQLLEEISNASVRFHCGRMLEDELPIQKCMNEIVEQFQENG